MEPRGLQPEHMNWNMMSRLFKRMLGLPTLIVKPLVWDKWCEDPCAQWEPSQLAGDFWPGVALAICYSQYQDLPNDNLQDQMVVSMTLIYIPEHWQLASFQESSYVINTAQEAGDTRGMISLTWVHKKAPFLLDVSYWEYKYHMTIIPVTPPGNDGLEMCGVPQDFAVRALHCKPESLCKNGKLTSWAPLAFQRATAGELQLLTRCSGKTWGGIGSESQQNLCNYDMEMHLRFDLCHLISFAPLHTRHTLHDCS